MASLVLPKHILFTVVVLIIFSDARADRRGSADRCRNDLSRCMGRRGIPCIGTGYNIQCYSPRDRCNGYYDCPYGDDEQYCGYPIRPTATRYFTRTVLRTSRTTSTRTSTYTSTSSTSTTTTTTSTTVTTSSTDTTTTTSVSVTPTTSTATTTGTFSSTLSSYVSAEIVAQGSVLTGGSTCQQQVAGVGVVGGANDYYFTQIVSSQVVSFSLTPSCSATTVTVT